MNNSLKILNIITNENLNDDALKKEILEDADAHFNLKLAVLFRRYYGICTLNAHQNPNEAIKAMVLQKRNERFEADKYWSIWKEEGRFFGFVEGFFHAQEGKNQLCKIRGRKVDEDFQLTPHRKAEIKRKFEIENQADYFKNPDIFAFRFRTLEEFRVFLRINKIERMVGRKEGMQKGMHFNIFEACTAIAKDEALKELFKKGVITDGGVFDKKFFDSSASLTQNGLYAVLSSFKGYGPKISKMVMNLVFDVPIVAVDRRVLKSALMLNFLELPAAYFGKIAFKYGMQNASEKELIEKVCAVSEKYPLQKCEQVLNQNFANSFFLSEADFLLFMYNGGEGWHMMQENDDAKICKVGKCCLDEAGVCTLRKKVEYKGYSTETSSLGVLRYN